MVTMLTRLGTTHLFVSNIAPESDPLATPGNFCFLSTGVPNKNALTVMEASQLPGAFAFADRTVAGQFAALRALMERYVNPADGMGRRPLIWTRNGSGTHALTYILANGKTEDGATLPLWAFAALPDTSPLDARFVFDIPEGTVVAFEPDRIKLSHDDLLLKITEMSRTVLLPVEGGELTVEISSGVHCGRLGALMEQASSSMLLKTIGPHVGYFWQDGILKKEVRANLLAKASGASTNLAMAVEFDPHSSMYPLSRCRFTRPDVALESTLLDVRSRALVLNPQTDPGTAAVAEIYFEQTPRVYASLCGDFAVELNNHYTALAGTEPVREVMVGGAGTELFQIGKDGYDGLRFVRGGHAWLHPSKDGIPAELHDKHRTAWLAPCRTGQRAANIDGGYSYVSQPEAQPLSGRRAPAASRLPGQDKMLAFDPAPRTVADTASMPILPFRSMTAAHTRIGLGVDRNFLSGARNLVAARAPAPRLARAAALQQPAPVWITTPQGLLVRVNEDNDWQEIQIATSVINGENHPVDWTLSILRPTENGDPVKRWALQEALSRSEVFVVISRLPVMRFDEPVCGPICLKMKIGEWGFETGFKVDSSPLAPVADPLPVIPLMVIKLGGGAIGDLAKDTSRWSLARAFNTVPNTASAQLDAAVKGIKLLSEGKSPVKLKEGSPPELALIPAELKPHYASLYKRLTDPEWNGVIVFNAETPFGSVPPAAQVVTGGDGEEGENKPKSFLVPMLGIDLNRLEVEQGKIIPGKTSAFAAIHYHQPERLPEGEEADGGFKFKLRNLNAVFENTELRTFLASMDLRLGSYFGSKTSGKSASRVLDIAGRYEQHGGPNGEQTYLFRALGSRTLKFGDDGLLAELTVKRLDVTTTVQSDGAASRFGIFGELAFTRKFSDLTGVRKIGFDNAALIMKNGKFDVDAGQVRVDFKKSEGGSGMDSLMGDFPFKLSALRWSGGKLPITLPDIGFAPLNIGPTLEDLFDFALEFDLNLGSLGKLADAAQFLKGKILVGWTDMSGQLGVGKWTVGFRFDGGSGPLDIGINGVLRLRAEEVSLKSYSQPFQGIGLGLLNPQLEVMGYKIPKDPSDILLAVIPDKAREKLGWVWASPKLGVGPLTLDWFALGQRMKLAGDVAPRASLENIIEASRELFKNGTVMPDVGEMYSEDAGWALVAQGKLGAFATRLVFLDGPEIYGLGVDIPAIAKVDILYRKVAADLGVFSGEITPSVRSFEMGAANVTLPIFNFEAFTNGNWSINIGFNGNDFSRGTTVQVLPFLGSGGLRFARLDWRSSYVLYGPDTTTELRELYEKLKLDPVLEFSMALRVGIGKEINEGIFSAGVSLSVYGIFEGALAVPQVEKFDETGKPRRYLKLTGTAGILLEIFGSVNFSVISAAVCIRAWAETGLTLETWQPITINAAAGVSVRVRFVVAEFRVFGKKVVIAIHFSFAYTVRFRLPLNAQFDGDMPERYRSPKLPLVQQSRALAGDPLEPLAWRVHTLPGARQVLDVSVAAEPMLRGSEAVLLPMLLGSHVPGAPNPLASVAVDLLRWSLRLALGTAPIGPDPATVSLDQLLHLRSRVRPEKGKSLARWGAEPLDFAVVRAFLVSRIEMHLQEASSLLQVQNAYHAVNKLAAVEVPAGILLPWFGELAIFARNGAGPEQPVRDLYGADLQEIDPAWEALLFARLQRTRPDYTPEDAMLLKASCGANGLYQYAANAKPVVDVIVEDWAAALLQGIVQRAVELYRQHDVPGPDGKVPLTQDFAILCGRLLHRPDGEDSAALQVVQQASAFLHHGARVPAPPGSAAGGDVALAELLRLDIAMAQLPAGAALTLEFRPLQAGLMSGSAQFGPFDRDAAIAGLADARAALVRQPIAITVEVETGKRAPRRFPCDKVIALEPVASLAPSLRYLPFPAWVSLKMARAADVDASTMALQLSIEQRDAEPRPVLAPRWISKVDLRVREIKEATASALGGGKAVYAIAGVDERVRAVLDALQGPNSKASIRSARLAYRPPEKNALAASAAAAPLRFLAGEQAFMFVSNLSQEGAPPEELVASAQQDDDAMPVFAYLSSHDAVVKILLMASVVNGPGFQLGFTIDDPFAGMFASEQAVVISILLECELDGLPGSVQSFMDGVLFEDAALATGDTAVFKTPGHLETRSNVPDGQVALLVHRRNALPADDTTPEGPERDAKALAARYGLLDYEVAAGGDVEAVARGEVSPVGVDLTPDELEDIEKVGEPAMWRHRILVPMQRFARLAMAGAGANPYALVGTDLSRHIVPGLRDGAGHLLPDDMLTVAWKDEKVLYRSPITRFEEFAGATASWKLHKAGGSAQLHVELVWDAATLFPDHQKDGTPPETRQAVLQAEFVRLAQMCSGPGFTARVVVEIGGGELSAEAFTKEIAGWVENIADALLDKVPQRQVLKLVVDLASPLGLLKPQPLEMRALLAFARTPALCDPTLGDDEIARVDSVLGASVTEGRVDWKVLAKSFKEVFGDAVGLLRRVGMGKGQGAIWVMPGAMLPAKAASIRVKDAFFLAPAPLAKVFKSGSAGAPDWNGGMRQVEASDVDLNVLGTSAASLLERFLSPRAAYGLCRMPMQRFSALAAAKRSIAVGLSRRLSSVFGGDPPQREDAVDKFRNASGVDLRSAFDPAVTASVRLDESKAHHVFLYGATAIGSSSKHRTSPVRVPLGPNGMRGGFSLLARWADPGDNPSAVLEGPLRFSPRFVEVRDEAGEVNDYVPSDWYEIMWADPDTDRRITFLPSAGNNWKVPLPLRLIPPTPAVIRHGGATNGSALGAASLEDFVRLVRTWEYKVDLAVPREQHDTATVEIAFSANERLGILSEDPLFQALVAFSSSETELLALLANLEAGIPVPEAHVEIASMLFAAVGSALQVAPPAPLAAAQAPDELLKVTLKYTKDGADRLLGWAFETGAKRVPVARLLPFVSDSNVAEVQPIHPPVSSDDLRVARYKATDDVETAFKGGAGLSARRVSVAALDILKQVGARSSVRARRNEKLGDLEVSPVFVFDTAEVSSASAFMPHVRNADPFDMSKSVAGPESMLFWLRRLEAALFDKDPEIQARYSLDAGAGLRCPFGENSALYFQYPLHSLRGVAALGGGWVDAWAPELEAAIARLEPAARAKAQLSFDIKVYSTVNHDKPVITLAKLFLPVAKVTAGFHVGEHNDEQSKLRDEPPPLRIAEILFAETCALHGDPAQFDAMLGELSRFASGYHGGGLKAGRRPCAADLASPQRRDCWQACLFHTQANAFVKSNPWSGVTLWPAGPDMLPAAGVESWFAPDLDSGSMLETVRIAGPFLCTDPAAGLPLGVPLFLWGARVKAVPASLA